MTEKNQKTLYQVINYIKGLVDSNLLHKTFWLKVEISNINFHSSGHCYIDLVENKNGKTIAKCNAVIWSTNLQNISRDLADDFKNILKKGSEILCLAEVKFDTVYGLSIEITDVDKHYSIGELEKRKIETYKRIKKEDLLDRNKIYQLKIVLQKIAVVGSPNTSGHSDFMKELKNNQYGYFYWLKEYPCQVQGDKAELAIISRLEELQHSEYDVIVLIRGGGTKLDLEVFNSYNLAKVIALHNKPILTGIGHDPDISIADLVANQYFKTPSALAGFINSYNHNYENLINNTYKQIDANYKSKIQKYTHTIQQWSIEFRSLSNGYTRLRRGALHTVANRILSEAKEKLSMATQKLSLSKQIIETKTKSTLSSEKQKLSDFVQLYAINTKQISEVNLTKLKHKEELLSLYSKALIKHHSEYLKRSISIVQQYHPNNVLERGYAIARVGNKTLSKNSKLDSSVIIEIELYNRIIKTKFISESQKTNLWKTLLTKMRPKS